ncbi:MAG: biopolymer transporter ExbD [Pseudomonadales bacterium]|nr:biopolymer transporter ExbD [Pseudomonadales bacterium]
MKKSTRAIRMDRRHKRNQATAGINLVSLMDIFTILVFFLLVNSSNTQQPPSNKSIELPKSVAEQLPKETLVVMVTEFDIIVNGRPVEKVDRVLSSANDTIPNLQAELLFQARKSAAPVNEFGIAEREVTIMGDKEIPYKLLRRIMMTCSKSEYSRISLAVMRKTEDQSS